MVGKPVKIDYHTVPDLSFRQRIKNGKRTADFVILRQGRMTKNNRITFDAFNAALLKFLMEA